MARRVKLYKGEEKGAAHVGLLAVAREQTEFVGLTANSFRGVIASVFRNRDEKRSGNVSIYNMMEKMAERGGFEPPSPFWGETD